MNNYREIKNKVSECCSGPCKYRRGTTKDGEEVMVPFCCSCEKATVEVFKRLTTRQKKENREILLESIFPGITKMGNNPWTS